MTGERSNPRAALDAAVAVSLLFGARGRRASEPERWPSVTRFIQVVAMGFLLGCQSPKDRACNDSGHPSILDQLLLPSATAARVRAAECDLPTDKWETLPKIGRTNRTRWARESSLAIELLEKIKPQLSGMSAHELLDSLKTFPYPGYGSFPGVEYVVYLGGNDMIMKELKRRPKSELAALNPFREDRRAIWTGDSGPPLSIGELVRYDLLHEPY